MIISRATKPSNYDCTLCISKTFNSNVFLYSPCQILEVHITCHEFPVSNCRQLLYLHPYKIKEIVNKEC